MDERHGLVSHMGPARRLPEVHVLVEQLQQTQVLGQRGRQHKPGVGHEMVVVEGHLMPVKAVAKSHRESAFLVWGWGCQQPPFSLSRKAFSRIREVYDVVMFGGSGLSPRSCPCWSVRFS